MTELTKLPDGTDAIRFYGGENMPVEIERGGLVYPKNGTYVADEIATPGNAVSQAVGAINSTGLVLPSARSELRRIPKVMASPPTVALSLAGAASTITNAVAVPVTKSVNGTYVKYNLNIFEFYAGRVDVYTQSFPNNEVVIGVNANDTKGSGAYKVRFKTDAPVFEIRCIGLGGSPLRILCDGEYVQATPYAELPATGSGYYYLVTFSGRKMRSFVLECGGSFLFRGLNVGPNDTLVASNEPLGPKVVVFGDSYTAGTGADYLISAYWDTLAKLMGWQDAVPSSRGGTGYTVAGSSVAFIDRVDTDIDPLDPDLVFVLGGQNDSGTAAQTVGAAVSAFIERVRAGAPRAKIVIAGNQLVGGSPTASIIQTRDAIRAVAVAKADLYIDLVGGPYPYSGNTANYVNTGASITGTGKSGATTGAGNADVLVFTDGQHPTQAGHDFYGHLFATAVSAWIDAGTPTGSYYCLTTGLVTAP